MNKLYKVYTHWTPDNKVYVGVTSRDKLYKRWHPSQYKRTALEPYINEFGWENITHQVIYTTPDRAEAYQVEEEMRQYYTENGCCINKQRSGLVAKNEKAYNQQWYQDHKGEMAAYYQQYYQNHKEEHKDYMRKWRAKKKSEKIA